MEDFVAKVKGNRNRSAKRAPLWNYKMFSITPLSQYS